MLLGVGVVAAVIDVVPMIMQKIDKHSCVSAFIHWIFITFIIAYSKFPLPAWGKGLLNTTS